MVRTGAGGGRSGRERRDVYGGRDIGSTRGSRECVTW